MKLFGYSGRNGNNWFSSAEYGPQEIASIKDPNGGTTIGMPTAIPSPFAHIDLVKTAFLNITNTKNLVAQNNSNNGVTSVIASKDDEKLVSHVLDLAEILFNYNSLKNNLSIVMWNMQAELNKLKSSQNAGHRKLADVLELHFIQDSSIYNFDLLTDFFIIKYNHQIIGCTSPSTLFFVTANDTVLKNAQIRLGGNHVTFNHAYNPLYNRDPNFQKYLYALFESSFTLRTRMQGFYNYLQKNLSIVQQKDIGLYNDIKNINDNTFTQNYVPLTTGLAGQFVNVLGINLGTITNQTLINQISNSDFLIKSSKNNGGNIPLVLQNNFNLNWRYVTDAWNHQTQVPYFDSNSNLNNRQLPGISFQYPYLTVSDFLEPCLIRMVYPINDSKYFDGNLTINSNGDKSKGFLLPLKKMFFDFFDTDDLISTGTNKPQLEMTTGVQNSVKVTLKIPVKREGGYITFERVYKDYKDQIINADDSSRDGIIVEHQIGVSIYPFVKMNNSPIQPFYRIQLIDHDIFGTQQNANHNLYFFTNKTPVNIAQRKIRRVKNTTSGGSHYYILDNEFDFIQLKEVNGQGASGMIVPKWNLQQAGNNVFKFAVDFGTTNTHVEYKVNNEPEKPFDITKDDMQIATLFHPEKSDKNFGKSGALDLRNLIEYEFIPSLFGFEHRFPHRTVLAHNNSLNIDSETYTLADFNIPFVYEKRPNKDNVSSDLKWAKSEVANDKRIRAYFEQLIMMIRNKVLLNGGDLKKTEMVWFYPSSMKGGRKDLMGYTWKEFFNKYINENYTPTGIVESLAPFYYFSTTGLLTGGAYTPAVTIDIGGGTTDVVVFKNNQPIKLTSFKFAANSIFGDGFNEAAASNNGLIRRYVPLFEKLLRENNYSELLNTLKSIEAKQKSSDINTFLFSLENNTTINDKNSFSYNKVLRNDEDVKIVFLYFFSAIIYHIAELMEYHAIEMPNNIVFSGTGSKILTIISPNDQKLSQISQLIFEKVYQKSLTGGLKIIREEQIPKEVTCKGALKFGIANLMEDVSEIRTAFLNLGDNKLLYSSINDEIKNQLVNQIKGFNRVFIEISNQLNFVDNFNVSEGAFSIFKEELENELFDHLVNGLAYNKKLDGVISDEKEIEETLFFLPIIQKINQLFIKIHPIDQS